MPSGGNALILEHNWTRNEIYSTSIWPLLNILRQLAFLNSGQCGHGHAKKEKIIYHTVLRLSRQVSLKVKYGSLIDLGIQYERGTER